LVSGAGSAGTGALGAGLGVTARGLAATGLGAGGFNLMAPELGTLSPGGGRRTMRPGVAAAGASSMALRSTETADVWAEADPVGRPAKANSAAEHNKARRSANDGRWSEMVSNLSLAIGLKVLSLTPTPIWPLDTWAGLGRQPHATSWHLHGTTALPRS
jgi:hypothetical protein